MILCQSSFCLILTKFALLLKMKVKVDCKDSVATMPVVTASLIN